MRVLNAAQSTLAYLGVLAGHEHTFDAIADPLLDAFVRRMLVDRERAHPAAGPGHRRRSPMSSRASPACATPPSATAATRSPPTARRRSSQRLLNPAAERLAPRRARSTRLAVAIAAWMAYLVRASDRFGAPVAGGGPARPPGSPRSPTGSATTPRRWSRRSSRIDTVFDPALAARRGLPRAARRRARRPAVARPDGRRSAGRRLTRERRHEARAADRAVSRHAAARGRRLGERGRLRGAGDRLLAARLRPDPPLRRHQPHRRRQPLRRARAGEIVAALAEKGLAISGARLLPEPAAPRPRAPRGGHRPPEEGDRRRRPDGRAGWSTPSAAATRRRHVDANWAGGADGLARDRRPRPRPRREARLRELPDDLQLRRVAGRAQHRLFAATSGAASSRPGAATSA